MLERYYNRFDPAKRYTELLFRAGDGLQSAELNELQAILKHRVKSIADAVLKDGDLIEGGAILIDPQTGQTTCAAARLYLAGSVHEVPAATFALPTTGRVTIGARLRRRTITELDDPSLRDPAVGTRNYQEPGAGRLEETVVWGWVGDAASDGQTGEFYPIATVIEGVAAPPPDPLDAAASRIAALARSAPRLPVPKVAEAAEALGALTVELRARPNRPEEARRFLLVMLDGLERIAARLAAGAEPPETLPALLDDMIEGAGDMRRRLREAETMALDVQVKVLSDRLRQEGLA